MNTQRKRTRIWGGKMPDELLAGTHVVEVRADDVNVPGETAPESILRHPPNVLDREAANVKLVDGRTMS